MAETIMAAFKLMEQLIQKIPQEDISEGRHYERIAALQQEHHEVDEQLKQAVQEAEEQLHQMQQMFGVLAQQQLQRQQQT